MSPGGWRSGMDDGRLTPEMAGAPVCFLETVGRLSGRPHEIEIWFAAAGSHVLYMLSGGRDRADWVKNIRRQPRVRLRFGSSWFDGTARIVEGDAEDPL